MGNPTTYLEAQQLGKRFNREWIFRDLSHQFIAGNTYAIIGPNGSGKSTLLQVLWGQVPASAGIVQYQINGHPMAMEDIYQSVSIATPYLDLIEEFTLVEMLAFHFKMRKPRAGFATKDLARIFELDHAKDKLIGHFSSGMRQRLKLGLAIYTQASFIFLDEPFTNLDEKAIKWYENQLQQLKDTVVFIASNDPREYENSHEKIKLSNYKS